MAGSAGTDHIGVIDRIGWCPDRAVVTVFANVGRVDVRNTLAGRTDAIVATGAVTRDARVIERHR